ncbi:1-acyl-sn-glycerol-3-phosphate acyltransferase [Aliiglaciecola sp. CAU 1673]|uniref:1-acyl-sn-glycerol-3-phosphate acyltransferase n=1 Tax=Aliiglaciecola sp. CAU 1673 TaxID=3032595 RepID=UPI0023DB98D8|nr:1-acyl-sn-glycerol-3-phosphate acyltransferase [Aliiglaciecola sp. CAU 1673]MDF2178816.1 1-acyl-sn-glycerol-3-phosphate acyltransferase [Aliiglaciecola sp. CAU 1673]
MSSKINKLLSFLMMAKVKLVSHLFYRGRPNWMSEEKEEALKDVRLLVFLNHTSLFEPLFIRFAPWNFVWDIAHKVVVPGADVTLKRPMAGKVLKTLLPGCIPITRKPDESWQHFLSHVSHDVITAILPEGRMMRRDGLDKHGKPMTVRGGVAEILQRLKHGKMLFVYSGGLHHVQAPGERLPRLFKTLKANLEIVEIAQYKAYLHNLAGESFKDKVVADMNRRLKECVPSTVYPNNTLVHHK